MVSEPETSSIGYPEPVSISDLMPKLDSVLQIER